ncbi:hypothetical protein D3C76_1431540 [compost metagenome]
MRVGSRDTLAVQGSRTVPGFVCRGRQRQAAAAKVQATQGKVARVFALRATGQQLFFQHVFADDAKVNHAIHHQTWDIVIANAQDIDRHVLGEGD